MKKLVIWEIFTLFYIGILCSENYYVDSVNGSDVNSGTSPSTAWKSVKRVNEATFLPGDVIHFRAGQIWRESLRCQSGNENEPLTYTRYGGGAKPLFVGSIDLCFEDLWINKRNNIWYVLPQFFSTEIPEYRDIGNIILTQKGETENGGLETMVLKSWVRRVIFTMILKIIHCIFILRKIQLRFTMN